LKAKSRQWRGKNVGLTIATNASAQAFMVGMRIKHRWAQAVIGPNTLRSLAQPVPNNLSAQGVGHKD